MVESSDFFKYTMDVYQLVVIDKYMKFLTQDAFSIIIEPKDRDIGTYQVFLINKGVSSSIVQTLNIEVKNIFKTFSKNKGH